jgi:hypothetical protein
MNSKGWHHFFSFFSFCAFCVLSTHLSYTQVGKIWYLNLENLKLNKEIVIQMAGYLMGELVWNDSDKAKSSTSISQMMPCGPKREIITISVSIG